MRRPVDATRLRQFMSLLATAARGPARVYLTGGTTAVLEGWRESTIDIDLRIEPDDYLLRAIPHLKEELEINVELCSPDYFIPVPDDWRRKSPLIVQEGNVSFHHFDLVSQALAKIERGHARDLDDVRQMLARDLVSADAIRRQFDEVEPQLYRYPAVDPASFRRAVERATG